MFLNLRNLFFFLVLFLMVGVINIMFIYEDLIYFFGDVLCFFE